VQAPKGTISLQPTTGSRKPSLNAAVFKESGLSGRREAGLLFQLVVQRIQQRGEAAVSLEQQLAAVPEGKSLPRKPSLRSSTINRFHHFVVRVQRLRIARGVVVSVPVRNR
jgi:hypothetical protein